jgi:hypothetical protein
MKSFALLLLLITSHLCFGQSDSIKSKLYKQSYWLDIGGGWAGQGGAFDIGVAFQISAKKFISARFSMETTNNRCVDYVLFLPLDEHPLGYDADSYEFSYGGIRKGKTGIMTFSAGIAILKIHRGSGEGPPAPSVILAGSTCPENYKMTTETSFGIVLRTQFMPSIRWAGFGVSPFLNINTKQTFGGITLQLGLGRIRPREPVVATN